MNNASAWVQCFRPPGSNKISLFLMVTVRSLLLAALICAMEHLQGLLGAFLTRGLQNRPGFEAALIVCTSFHPS